MKKLLATLALCLGLCIGAYAQNAKADAYAEKMTVALHDLTNSKIDLDTYVEICKNIGDELGDYVATLEEEDIYPFLEYFYNCIYYHFAKYDFAKTDADNLINSFKQAFNAALNGEIDSRTSETVIAKADHFAGLLSDLIEDSLAEGQDEEEANKIGVQLGAYIGQLRPDEIKTFQSSFYDALTVHIARIPALSELSYEDIKDLVDMIKEQYDPIFEALN